MFWTSLIPAFLSSLVEFVEALTIVLAIGISVNWKSAFTGAAAALVVLCGLIAGLGMAVVTYVPLGALRLVIGLLLILFGAQWLKKSLLRYSGLKPLRDESSLFQKQVQAGTEASLDHSRFSRYGFLASFKSVLLEGLEVAFIVVTFGSSSSGAPSDGLWAAIEGALAALAVVVVLGLLLHKPLTRVPENLLKFAVGWLLLTFGLFWAGEGLGIEWPFADLFPLIIGAITLAVCGGLIRVLTVRRRLGYRAAGDLKAPRTRWGRVLFEIFDFFCGDWWMAGGTALAAVLSCILPVAGVTFVGCVLAMFCVAVVRATVLGDADKNSAD